MSNIRIDIASEFKDTGFKKAEKASTALGKTFDNLAGKIGAALSVAAITKFSKAAIQAFGEDDKAARRLIQTYKNLGMSFEGALTNDYIDRLQRATGVADTQLRPALETITRATLDFGKSQRILSTALDVSAGSGHSVEKVALALSKAYLGQGSALGKLNVGIGQVESTTISFDAALARLNDRFKGQATTAAMSYEGQLNRLKISADEAQETLGKHLVTAINRLTNSSDLSSLGNQFENMADNAGLIAVGMADVVGQLNKKVSATGADGWITKFNDFMSNFNIFTALQERGQGIVDISVKQRTLGAPGAEAQARKDAELRKKAIADNKKLIALQKKAEQERLKREREAQALKRAGTVFDMENIQIVAAMQAKITENERLRLAALFAINTGNAEAAEKLSTAVLAANAAALANLGIMMQSGDSISDVVKKIIEAQGKAAILGMNIGNIPKAPNPFEAWPSIIAGLLAQIGQLNGAINGLGKGGTGGAGGGAGTGGGGGSTVGKGGNSGVGGQTVTVPSAITPPAGVSPGTSLGGGFTMGANQYPNSSYFAGIAATSPYIPSSYFATAPDVRTTPPTVVVNIAGNVSTEQDLIDAVTQGIYEIQKRGQSITLNAVGL